MRGLESHVSEAREYDAREKVAEVEDEDEVEVEV